MLLVDEGVYGNVRGRHHGYIEVKIDRVKATRNLRVKELKVVAADEGKAGRKPAKPAARPKGAKKKVETSEDEDEDEDDEDEDENEDDEDEDDEDDDDDDDDDEAEED
eukprot:SAG22_NODE_8382_length_659_cov_0.918004_1_plen_107_part_01